jgi:hypothetical protein
MPETAQPTPETDEKKSRGLGSYVLWAFVAVVVYVLSMGPMLRFVVSRRPTSATTNIFKWVYFPVGYAYNKTLLHKPIGLYLHLWVPSVFDEKGEAN